KPFDKSLPTSIQNSIKLNHILSDVINADALIDIFSHWEIVEKAPELTLSPIGKIESDFTGGFATSLNEEVSGWETTPRIYTIPQQTISLGGLGLGFRLKNAGENDVQFRLNMTGSDGIIYSFAY